MKPKISVNILFTLFLFFAVIGFAILNGFFRRLQTTIIFKEALYYFKPILFVFFGLFFLKEKSFNKLIVWIFFIVLFGSLLYYSDPTFYIGKAIEKAPEAQGEGHFYAIHGRILRNSSLLLSPLETGYVSFFLSSYFFIFYRGKGRTSFLIISLVLLLSTFTRSSIIGFLVAFVTYRLFTASVVKKLYLVIWFGLIAIIVSIVYFEQLRMILIEDGSAVVHFKNLFEGIAMIIKKPWGYGIGYSGFGSLQSQGEQFYSEGSFFTTLIEGGILFAFFYVSMYYYLYKKSKQKLLPVYVGFLIASLLIPIGFSTTFAGLFFSYFGIIIKNGQPAIQDSNHTD